MKNFKQYLEENVDDGLGFGEADVPIGFKPGESPFFGQSLGKGSNAISGLDPENMPYTNYRSAALSPGQKQDDPNYVAGGGGFKIEKDSKSFLLNIAKKYGILIPGEEQGQGGMQQPQQQQQPQQAQQPPQDRLVNHLSMNPIMSDLMNSEVGKQFNKIFAEMQKWKTDANDPKLIQKSQEPQNPYKIWAEKAKEEMEKKKKNISVQGNILRHRMFASDIYDRLNDIGLYDGEFNPHVKNYTDPYHHDEDLLQQLQQQAQQQQAQQYPYEDEEDYYNDSESGIDFGYYGQ